MLLLNSCAIYVDKCGTLSPVDGVRLNCDRADGDEENAANKVDENLEHRQVGAHHVGEEDSWYNYGIPTSIQYLYNSTT